MTTATRRRAAAGDPSDSLRDRGLRVHRLHLEAMETTLPAKAEQTLRQWIPRQRREVDEETGLKVAVMAMVMATELESFTPSHTGSTAVDRLARRRKLDAADETAWQALRTARFSIFVVRRPIGGDLYAAEDLASGRAFTLHHGRFPFLGLGIPLAARLFTLDAERQGTVGMILPLDEASLAVTREFVKPGRGIVHGYRCAAAVYRHTIRHGGPIITGLNVTTGEPIEDDDDLDSPFDAIVADLVLKDTWRHPPVAVLNEVRRLVSADAILLCLYKAVAARPGGAAEPGTLFRRFAEVMMEALHLRALAGSGLDAAPLDRLSTMVDQQVATNGFPHEAAELFRAIRRTMTTAKPREAGEDLTRVIERIRGLRAKTVDQGCTEEEALAAADKVAELLDRYGLSLGETDLRQQACHGFGIDSGRKRAGALDEAVPAISDFCDCRSWTERTADDTIRSVFFGLPADVEAARYLHERVATALETETAAFQRGEIYRNRVGGGRQKATTSFQYGLIRGICAKLDARKRERDTRTFQATGRDLVPVKASVVEDELAKLGMAFTSKASARGRMVLPDAYEAGRVASGRFEIQSELERA